MFNCRLKMENLNPILENNELLNIIGKSVSTAKKNKQ